MGRALLRRPQPPLHHIRRRHRPSAASGDQRRPRPPASLHETIRAVLQLSSGKAPGSDAIPTEIYRRGGLQLMNHLTALFQDMTGDHLLNQRRMHVQSRVSKTIAHELLFADACALNTTSEEDMQRSMDLFSAACENFDLVINRQKTAVMH
nr:unnamed protein product [Spirometra erinaceieuropaei]